MNPSRFSRIAVVVAVAGLALLLALSRRGEPGGNRLVIVNASPASLDSIAVWPDPGSPTSLRGALGYLAAGDSATLDLPRASGDANVRLYRRGGVAAHHVVYWAGNTVFELTVSAEGTRGRYRRVD